MTPERHVHGPFILPLSPYERRTNPVAVLSVVASRRPLHTGHRTGGARATTIVTGASGSRPGPRRTGAVRVLCGPCPWSPARGCSTLANMTGDARATTSMTGAAGFIGLALVKVLIGRGYLPGARARSARRIPRRRPAGCHRTARVGLRGTGVNRVNDRNGNGPAVEASVIPAAQPSTPHFTCKKEVV